MAVAALVDDDVLGVDPPELLVEGPPLQVLITDSAGGDDGHLPGIEESHVAGGHIQAEQRQDGREVAGDDGLAVPVGDQDAAGVTQAHGADLVGVALLHDGHGLGATEQAAHPAEGILQGEALVESFLNEVGDDLGVGFRGEVVAAIQEVLLKLEIVLDDAVVDDGEVLVAAGVGMAVGVGGVAVGGPAGVSQAGIALGNLHQGIGGEAHHLADGLAELEVAVFVADGDAGAIVSAVLQPLQPLKDNRPGGLSAYVSDYAAHGPSLDYQRLPGLPAVSRMGKEPDPASREKEVVSCQDK